MPVGRMKGRVSPFRGHSTMTCCLKSFVLIKGWLVARRKEEKKKLCPGLFRKKFRFDGRMLQTGKKALCRKIRVSSRMR